MMFVINGVELQLLWHVDMLFCGEQRISPRFDNVVTPKPLIRINPTHKPAAHLRQHADHSCISPIQARHSAR